MDRYEDFRTLPDEEIIRRVDNEAPKVVLGVSFYFEELNRRRAEASALRAERLVRLTMWLTATNAVVALIAAAAAVVALAG
jgi:uncharacterized membrane protein